MKAIVASALLIITVSAGLSAANANVAINHTVNKAVTSIITPSQSMLVDRNEWIVKSRYQNGTTQFKANVGVRTLPILQQNSEFVVAGGSGQSIINVDIIELKTRLDRWNVRLGKQLVRWGTSTFFSPTDLFNQGVLTNPYLTEQGIPSIQARTHFDPLSYIDLVWIAPIAASASATVTSGAGLSSFGVRYTTNWEEKDIHTAYVFGGTNNYHYPSIAIKGDLNENLSFHFENIYQFENTDSPDYKLVLGLDGLYWFSPDFSWQAELFLQNDGTVFNTYSNALSAVNFSGTRYLLLFNNWVIDTFSSAHFAVIPNLEDGSFMLMAGYDFPVGNELSSQLVSQAFSGTGTQDFSPERLGHSWVFQGQLTFQF